MERRVKGSLFVDYVRMLRSRKDVNWKRYLQDEDLPFLVERIHPDGWYPMETFARFGLAILDEIAHGDPFLARAWGRLSADQLVSMEPEILAEGDPRESVMRLVVHRRSFFDFDVVDLTQLSDTLAEVRVNYGMTPRAEQAACLQTLGFFGRLVELAGGRGVMAQLIVRSWEGDAITAFTVTWEPPA
jgi:hypothetical protein